MNITCKTYVKLSIRHNTSELLKNCIKLYRQHHPELNHMPISQDKIIYEICKYYIQ